METCFSYGDVCVDRRSLSIHAYGAQEPLSRAAGKAHLSHALSIGMASLVPPPCHGAMEWRWRAEAGCIGEERGASADLAVQQCLRPCVCRATIRRLCASCARRLTELWPEQSKLCMGRACAEPELHGGGYRRRRRRTLDQMYMEFCARAFRAGRHDRMWLRVVLGVGLGGWVAAR